MKQVSRRCAQTQGAWCKKIFSFHRLLLLNARLHFLPSKAEVGTDHAEVYFNIIGGNPEMMFSGGFP